MIVVTCGLLGLICVVYAEGQQTPDSGPVSTRKEAIFMRKATGTFDVKAIPQKADNKEAESAKLGRVSLEKQFHGGLEATSTGEMLSAGDGKTSGAYVALERVSGTLDGRKGSFVLQHNGTMTRGVPHLMVTVVPDSGTEELEGLTGSMTIKIEGGKHLYEFEYRLEEKH